MAFILKVEQGKLSAGSEANKARLNEELRLNEGKEYRLEKIQAKRSLSQNNFLWLYYGIIERETGNDSISLHEYFKRELLPPKFIKLKGKEYRVSRSTTELNKIEFGEYLDKICALSNVPIPDPTLLEGYISN
jgi:hypothetical protein